MELPIRGIEARKGVSGIGGQRRQRREGDPEFELELPDEEEARPETDDDRPSHDGDLPTAGASDDEAGSRLDVTA